MPSRAIGAEVNPLAIAGPSGSVVLGRFCSEAAGRAPLNADNVDIGVPARAGSENDLPAVRGETRGSSSRPAERGQLDRVRAVGVAGPDLETARAIGHKGNAPAVGGVCGLSLSSAGCDQARRRPAHRGCGSPRTGDLFNRKAPDVVVRIGVFVGQPEGAVRRPGNRREECALPSRLDLLRCARTRRRDPPEGGSTLPA